MHTVGVLILWAGVTQIPCIWVNSSINAFGNSAIVRAVFEYLMAVDEKRYQYIELKTQPPPPSTLSQIGDPKLL